MLLRLVDLEPRFIRHEERGPVELDICDADYDTTRKTHKEMRMQEWAVPVETVAEANGIRFLCPLCFTANSGAAGTHGVQVTFAGRSVPDHLGSHAKDGSPSRWNVAGTTFVDLTLTPSILLTGGCAWHGFVTNGDVT